MTCGPVSACQAHSCLWQSTAVSAVIFFKGMCWLAKCILAEAAENKIMQPAPAWTPHPTLLSNKKW